ncbi:DUF2878 domain-containing protein [Shewanella gelidii]|uniref:DUF2878 domain-containing protein n=1 Tax=Shewanella gelidii TaxID=1642821 RepID=A0A917JJX4_9GAMM|nr:DUF2878 domain-containing protein [Shewanella gelidii]MCL1096735.1 DUF2878 domain-containing protein [Shewanella gelidii]GGI69817.1 hypothetical protein GCM10009332_03690 [Shewanella gelidii]
MLQRRFIAAQGLSRLTLFNLVAFQLIWWLGVLYGNQSLLIIVIILWAHLFISPRQSRDAKLFLMGALIGAVIDGALIQSGLLIFTEFPIWLGLLWGYLFVCLPYSLRFFSTFPVLAKAFIGGISGGGSYYSGEIFGAVQLQSLHHSDLPFLLSDVAAVSDGSQPSVMLSVLCIVCIWAVLFPLMFVIEQRITSKAPNATGRINHV